MEPSSKMLSRLNPNAAEFVPSGLRSGSSLSSLEESNVSRKSDGKKVVLNRTNSANSTTSEDEYRQYWQAQLPDDITPDFDFLSEAADDRFIGLREGALEHGPSEMRDPSLLTSRVVINDGTEKGSSNELLGDPFLSEEMGEIDPIGLLVNEFPGFAAESLADIFTANGGDLSLTIEMLTQLELQEETGPAQHSQSHPSSSPNLDMMDFPALAGSDLVNGAAQFDGDLNIHQSARTMQAAGLDKLFTSRSFASGDSRAATDFAAAVRKNAAAQWQYDRNGQVDYGFSSSRAPLRSLEGDSHAGDSKASDGEKLELFPERRRSQSAPTIWLETGEAVSNIYADLREEARDHARVRNAYFEQARQAYLVGNKALAKELSLKGQWHNGLMKNAHNKAGEAIFQQRNMSTGQIQNLSRGQPELLDLHGLHVNEAIPLLKRELAALRVAARSTQQRQQVFICVGTGHHTKGSRTPARLPVAVERYLAEDEHLHFTEQQPGLLRVVLS